MAARAERIASGSQQPLHRDLLAAAHPQEHFLLFVPAGIADSHLEHEPVELRFRQRIGTLALDRVLGGEHHKRLFQRIGGAADGHLMLLHSLQQRRLHLGGRPVDFIRQDDLGEERSLLDVKFLALLVEDHGADHVGRQQIRGELDAGERRVDDFGQGAHRQSLGQPGHSLQQNVPAGEQPDQQPLHHRVLSHDAAGHFLEYPRDRQ